MRGLHERLREVEKRSQQSLESSRRKAEAENRADSEAARRLADDLRAELQQATAAAMRARAEIERHQRQLEVTEAVRDEALLRLSDLERESEAKHARAVGALDSELERHHERYAEVVRLLEQSRAEEAAARLAEATAKSQHAESSARAERCSRQTGEMAAALAEARQQSTMELAQEHARHKEIQQELERQVTELRGAHVRIRDELQMHAQKAALVQARAAQLSQGVRSPSYTPHGSSVALTPSSTVTRTCARISDSHSRPTLDDATATPALVTPRSYDPSQQAFTGSTDAQQSLDEALKELRRYLRAIYVSPDKSPGGVVGMPAPDSRSTARGEPLESSAFCCMFAERSALSGAPGAMGMGGSSEQD